MVCYLFEVPEIKYKPATWALTGAILEIKDDPNKVKSIWSMTRIGLPQNILDANYGRAIRLYETA